MKKLLLLSLLAGFTATAQTTLFQNNFTAGPSGWTLQQGNAFNTWVVNNVYSCTYPTPNQGGGNYLHVYDDLSPDYCAAYVILGSGSGETVYATMTTSFSTVGQPAVTIQYDWLCQGQTGPVLSSFGFVEYSVDGGNSWTTFLNPLWKHNGQPNWVVGATITSAQEPGILNQANLRLRFGFTSSGYGTNPSFAIDNLLVTGSLSTSTATATDNNEYFSVFPNPTKGNFSLDLSGLSNDVTIEVIDALGRIIKTEKVLAGTIVPVQLENVIPGIYNVRVSGNGKTASKTLVIN